MRLIEEKLDVKESRWGGLSLFNPSFQETVFVAVANHPSFIDIEIFVVLPRCYEITQAKFVVDGGMLPYRMRDKKQATEYAERYFWDIKIRGMKMAVDLANELDRE